MPGPQEILVIAVIILILFGAAAIPKFAKSLGQAKSEFQKGVREGEKKGLKTEKNAPNTPDEEHGKEHSDSTEDKSQQEIKNSDSQSSP